MAAVPGIQMVDNGQNDDRDVATGQDAGLRMSGKRALMRTVLLATGLTLGGFAVLQALPATMASPCWRCCARLCSCSVPGVSSGRGG